MHEFGIFDLAGLVAVAWVLVKVVGPVATALARRIEGRPRSTTDDSAVLEVREELEELHERVDFLERAIASGQPPTKLPRAKTPE